MLCKCPKNQKEKDKGGFVLASTFALKQTALFVNQKEAEWKRVSAP